MNLLLLLLLGSIWGTSFLFIKVIVAEVPPLTLVAGRLCMSALAAWILIGIKRIPLAGNRRNWKNYAVVGLLNGALPFFLISWGEQYIPSGWAALVQSMTPIFTILFAHFLTQDDQITIPKLIGVVLGFCGVGLLMLPELQEGIGASVWGMLAIVGSSISYALASIYARHHLQHMPPMVSSAGQFTMGALYILPLSLLIDRPFHLAPSAPAILSWVTLALLGTVFAYGIYYTLLKRTSATFTTMVTYIVPINGLILGALVLSERLHPSLIISLVLIFAGVLLVRYKHGNPTPQIQTPDVDEDRVPPD